MKRKAIFVGILFLSTSCLFAEDIRVSEIDSLQAFFGDEDYCTLGKRLVLEHREMYISGIFSDYIIAETRYTDKIKILTKAIVYEKRDCEFITHLVFSNKKMTSRNDEIVMDFETETKFFGVSLWIMLEGNAGFIRLGEKLGPERGLAFYEVFGYDLKDGGFEASLIDPPITVVWNEDKYVFEAPKRVVPY